MARVVIDAMGGDHAPRAIAQGAVAATRNLDDLEVILVGDESKVRAELPDDCDPERVHVVHAADVIEMHESPVEAMRYQ